MGEEEKGDRVKKVVKGDRVKKVIKGDRVKKVVKGDRGKRILKGDRRRAGRTRTIFRISGAAAWKRGSIPLTPPTIASSSQIRVAANGGAIFGLITSKQTTGVS